MFTQFFGRNAQDPTGSMIESDPFLKQLAMQIANKKRQLLSPQVGQLPGFGFKAGQSPYGLINNVIGAPPPPPPPTAGEYPGLFARFR